MTYLYAFPASAAGTPACLREPGDGWARPVSRLDDLLPLLHVMPSPQRPPGALVPASTLQELCGQRIVHGHILPAA